MDERWLPFGIGFVAGLRTMTASAALSWAASLGRTRPAWFGATPPMGREMATAAAIAEMAGDKMPFAPDRRSKPSFAVRAMLGATGGWMLAGPEMRPAGGAVLGVAGAVAGTLIGRFLRGGKTRTKVDWTRALLEDAVAAGLAVMVVRAAGRPRQTRRV